MGTARFTPEFKEEAVKQVTQRGYSVAEVAARIGVSAHSLYKWVKAVTPDVSEQQSKELLEAKSEILRLRAPMVAEVAEWIWSIGVAIGATPPIAARVA